MSLTGTSPRGVFLSRHFEVWGLLLASPWSKVATNTTQRLLHIGHIHEEALLVPKGDESLLLLLLLVLLLLLLLVAVVAGDDGLLSESRERSYSEPYRVPLSKANMDIVGDFGQGR